MASDDQAPRRRIVIDFPRSPEDSRPYAPALYEMFGELEAAMEEGNGPELLESLLVEAFEDGMNWVSDALATQLGPDEPARS